MRFRVFFLLLLLICYLSRSFWEILADGGTYDQLVESMHAIPESSLQRFFDSTFRFNVIAFGRHYTQEYKCELLKKTAFLSFWDHSKVDPRNPTHK